MAFSWWWCYYYRLCFYSCIWVILYCISFPAPVFIESRQLQLNINIDGSANITAVCLVSGKLTSNISWHRKGTSLHNSTTIILYNDSEEHGRFRYGQSTARKGMLVIDYGHIVVDCISVELFDNVFSCSAEGMTAAGMQTTVISTTISISCKFNSFMWWSSWKYMYWMLIYSWVLHRHLHRYHYNI